MIESKRSKLKSEIISIILLVIISMVYLLFFSLKTSPIYDVMGGDSDIFIMMGKFMEKGMIPYKEFFDHKGPVIFFVEWLGYKLNQYIPGLFLIQTISLTVTLCGVRKLAGLFFDSNAKSIGVSIISLGVLNMYYENGNLTEEYCLPFLMWSTYFVFKYFKKSDFEEHKIVYSVLYGITFMVGALTRLTNAVPICILVMFGTGIFLQKKKWKLLLANASAFIGGGLIVAIPFVIYFISNNALHDMIYATFIYNFKYAVSEFESELSLVDQLKQIIYWTPLIVVVLVGIINIVHKKEEKIISISLLISGVVAILMQLNSARYLHYLMIWLPICVVASCLIIDMISKEKIIKYFAVACIMSCVGIIGIKNVSVLKMSLSLYKSSDAQEFRNDARDIQNEIPEDKLDDVIAYNVLSRFYVETDILPCYRYCVLQDWQCSKDQDMYDDIEDYLSSAEAEYIVINNNSNNIFDDIVYENYSAIKENQRFVLLKKNE